MKHLVLPFIKKSLFKMINNKPLSTKDKVKIVYRCIRIMKRDLHNL